jgi:hypothetical protein
LRWSYAHRRNCLEKVAPVDIFNVSVAHHGTKSGC